MKLVDEQARAQTKVSHLGDYRRAVGVAHDEHVGAFQVAVQQRRRDAMQERHAERNVDRNLEPNVPVDVDRSIVQEAIEIATRHALHHHRQGIGRVALEVDDAWVREA